MRVSEVIFRVVLLINTFAIVYSATIGSTISFAELKERLLANIQHMWDQVREACGNNDEVTALNELERVKTAIQTAAGKIGNSEQCKVSPSEKEQLDEILNTALQRTNNAIDIIKKRGNSQSSSPAIQAAAPFPGRDGAIPLSRTFANNRFPTTAQFHRRKVYSIYEQDSRHQATFTGHPNRPRIGTLASDSSDSGGEEEFNHLGGGYLGYSDRRPGRDYGARRSPYDPYDNQFGQVYYPSQYRSYGNDQQSGNWGSGQRTAGSAYDANSFYGPEATRYANPPLEYPYNCDPDEFGRGSRWLLDEEKTYGYYRRSPQAPLADTWGSDYSWNYDRPKLEPRRPDLAIIFADSYGEAEGDTLCIKTTLKDIMTLYDSVEKLFKTHGRNLEKLCEERHGLFTPLSEKYAQAQIWLLSTFPEHAQVLSQCKEDNNSWMVN